MKTLCGMGSDFWKPREKGSAQKLRRECIAGWRPLYCCQRCLVSIHTTARGQCGQKTNHSESALRGHALPLRFPCRAPLGNHSLALWHPTSSQTSECVTPEKSSQAFDYCGIETEKKIAKMYFPTWCFLRWAISWLQFKAQITLCHTKSLFFFQSYWEIFG